MNIQSYAQSRGIRSLIHFTRKENISSILQNGLVRRDILIENGFVNYNDQIRVDRTSAICATISFPNYKMFFSLQRANPNTEWAVLEIHPRALWELECAFCFANAASAEISAIPINERKSLNAFTAMFNDVPGVVRENLGIPNEYTTNPQAEVLFLNGIPREYIKNINVKYSAERDRLLEARLGCDVWYNWGYFSPRSDYEHWR
ncbi:DarT ssDNA thymidine ADP-ribosyltransferase family protein [Comamonas sp. MYb396]|uniref:DarT ssDNA thymidine ADP-ribosyltransferase family protein n=1 Tax=Comamonas sp. MYb396 TaxID=2745302 RepID=UPI003098CA44